jgi:hypothetical protein
VDAPKALGDEQLDPLPDQLLAAVAEQLLGLRVDQQDTAVAVDDHHRVRRRLEQTAELLLGAAALADVADRARHPHAVFGLDRTQADLHGKLGAVLAQPEQRPPRAHRTRLRRGEEVRAVTRVLRAEALRDQLLECLAEQLLALVAEQSLGLRIDQLDLPVAVDHHDSVGRGLDQRAVVRVRPHLHVRALELPQGQHDE